MKRAHGEIGVGKGRLAQGAKQERGREPCEWVQAPDGAWGQERAYATQERVKAVQREGT